MLSTCFGATRAQQFDLEPKLPGRRKRHCRYEDGAGEAHFHDDPKDYYRQYYYEAIDLAVNCIGFSRKATKYIAS